jgi:hypothetical protein
VASITIASSVGRGGGYTASEGEPIYVDAEYVDPIYQEYRDEVKLVGTGDIAYTIPEFAHFDDGINFKSLNASNIVQSFSVANNAEQQRAALAVYTGVDQAHVSSILETIPTLATIKLLPLSGGPFLGINNITVQHLVIPKQIDLESAT